jgi:hypothetical protein
VFFAILYRVGVPGQLTLDLAAGEQTGQLPVRNTYGVATTAINDGMEIIDNQRYAYYLQYCIANDSQIYTTRVEYNFRNAGE